VGNRANDDNSFVEFISKTDTSFICMLVSAILSFVCWFQLYYHGSEAVFFSPMCLHLVFHL
jgi:hypothetical protein